MVLKNGDGLGYCALDEIMVNRLQTFNFRHEAKALLEVRTDAVEAPAELGVAAVLVGAAGVVTHIQLIATLGHGRDAHVHLAHSKEKEHVLVSKCGGCTGG